MTDERNESAIDYLTSDEAKTLVCPYMGGRCYASECMLWRWALAEVKIIDETVPLAPVTIPTGIIKRTGRGYCGGGK